MAISASRWAVTEPIGVNQGITDHSTTKKHDVGYRVKCKDLSSNNRGYGEFIYLVGVASTAAGDAVVFDESTGATTRAVAASVGPLAIAMSACVASEYGWYQIYGVGVVTAGDVADNGPVYTTATDGTLDDAVVIANQVIGAIFRSDDDTGFATIGLNYPNAGAGDIDVS